MSLLNKIGDKLHRGKEDQSGRLSSDDYEYSDSPTNTTNGSRQHPFGTSDTGTLGTGIVGGTAVGGSHRTDNNVPGSFPGENNYGTATASSLPDRTLGDHTTTTTTTNTNTSVLGKQSGVAGSNTDHNIPRKPHDPYSSSGQKITANAANERNTYGASNNRGPAGDVGSRRDWDDPAVQRTQHGGISNQLQSGPHSELENRDAVPIAGGQKIGTGAAYDSPSQGQPQQHYGSGTSGYGGHDATHGRDHLGADSTRETGQKTAGPHNSSLLNKLDPRVESDPNKAYGSQTSGTHDYGSQTQSHHYGRDATVVGSAGVPEASSHYSDRDRQYGHNQYSSANQPLSQSRDFNDRHNTTGTTLSSPRDRDNDRYSGDNYERDRNQTTGPHNSNLLNKLDPRVDSTSNNRDYDDYSRSYGQSSGGSLLNSRHAGYDQARQNHGGGTYGVGYEKGYETGYRDALAHAESQRGGRY